MSLWGLLRVGVGSRPCSEGPRSLLGVANFRTLTPLQHQPISGLKGAGRRRVELKPPTSIPGVKHIVAVSSAKGGVGKSTVAANLAVALAFQNKKVALLDVDVFGPSVPRMMNLKGKPSATDDGMLVPMVNYNVKCMSMGLLAGDDSPMVWRGPMVMGALEQMLHKVKWGDVDVLVLDMPPGTGDAQLTVTQRVPVSGAVVVSTPQDIALIDARRGVNMFRKVGVPILGLVENMSYYQCSSCGHRDHIFGKDGAKECAEEMDMEFLGDIPLHMTIRERADSGAPVAIDSPDSDTAAGAHSRCYHDIARRVVEKLESA